MKNDFKKYLLFGLILGSAFYAYFFVSSYENKITHPALTEQSAKLFNQTAREKITEQEIEWMKKGSVDEDNLPRPLNHFYDPIYKAPLKKDINGVPAKTAIDWAHSSVSQTSFILTDDYTWEAAIYYYQNGNKEKAYITLGHVLHLLEDMGVPAHVRDDAHIFGDPYETWVENYLKVNKFNIIPGLSINNCASLDQCFSELAYYTNTNFFSVDTITSGKYEDPVIVKEKWEKINGEELLYGYNIDGLRLLSIKKTSDSWGRLNPVVYNVELPEIHQSYFNNLAPEVISYGAGLIKLFHEEAKKNKEAKPLTWWQEKINPIKKGLNDSYTIAKNTLAEDARIIGLAAKKAGNGLAEGIEKSADAVTEGIDYVDNKIVLAANRIGLDVSIIKKENIGNVLVNTKEKIAEGAHDIKGKMDETKVNIEKEMNEAKKDIKENVVKPLSEAPQKLKEPVKKVIAKIKPSIKLIKAKEKQEKNAGENNDNGENREQNNDSKEGVTMIAFSDIKYVIDGDTIELKNGQKIRYIGIDTPELNNLETNKDDECMAWAARERNNDLLKASKEITLISDKGADKDKYGRLLRYVYANTIFANRALAQEGMARIFICEAYMKNCPVMKDMEKIGLLITAGKDAEAHERGVYSSLCITDAKLSSKNMYEKKLSMEENKVVKKHNQPLLVPGRPDEKSVKMEILEQAKEEIKDEENKNLIEDGEEQIKDKKPPKTKLKNLINQDGQFLIDWEGVDLESGIASYDLRYRADGNGWIDLEKATTAISMIFDKGDITNSQEYCFQARAEDKAGNVENWAEEGDEQFKCSLVSKNEDEKNTEVFENVEMTDNDEALDVVINEIAWMGTKANVADEWLELYNNTGFPLDLEGWKLQAKDGTPSINLAGVIKPYEYFLLERTDDNTIIDTGADQKYKGELGNGGEVLELRNNEGKLIDYVNCQNAWHEGNNEEKKSMERIDPAMHGMSKENWGTNDGEIENGMDVKNNPIAGTPKKKNSATSNAGINPHQIRALAEITANQYLSKMQSPYLITGNVNVNEEAILNIGKGAIIKFNQNGILSVKGGLTAYGTKKWPIIFTSYKNDYYGDSNNDGENTAPAPGDWGRLEFLNGKDSNIENAFFSYGGFAEQSGAGAAADINNTRVDISNSWFLYNKKEPHNPAITYRESVGSEFKFNVLRDNGAGIKVSGGEIFITENLIENNAGNGILLKGSRTKAEIDGNEIKNNHNSAADCNWESAYPIYAESLYFTLSDNEFFQNDFDGIFISTVISKNITLPKAIYSIGDLDIPKSYTVSIIPGTILKNFDSFITLDGKIAVTGIGDVLFTSFYDDSPEAGGDTNNDNGAVLPKSGEWHWRLWNNSDEELPDSLIMRYGGQLHGQ